MRCLSRRSWTAGLQDLVYDAEALMEEPSPAAAKGELGSGTGEDEDAAAEGEGAEALDEDTHTKGGEERSGGSSGGGGAGSGGEGGQGGATPVLMTGRRAPTQKGMCHVQGCHRSLAGLRDYYQRYKICELVA